LAPILSLDFGSEVCNSQLLLEKIVHWIAYFLVEFELEVCPSEEGPHDETAHFPRVWLMQQSGLL